MVANVKDETSSSSATQSELKKGPWKPEEDMLLIEYVKKHDERDWNMVRKYSGPARCGKSCRLRWNNHLRPNLRKGPFSPDEEKLICQLHSKIGNKWARIATMLPGRTDNEIKNFWNSRVKRLARKGVPLYPSDIQCPGPDQLNPYLQCMDGQNNTSSPTPMAALQFNLQTQVSPTTPNSHFLLYPPPSSPSQQPLQFSQYDVVLQNSIALYDAALENSRQQQQQQMFESAMMSNKNNDMTSSLDRFKRHRSVPNLTISLPLHPSAPLGISSPLGQSASIASCPTASYMQVTPTPSPHSYTSSPTGRMVVSPTALQLGIPMSLQPSFRFPPFPPSPTLMEMRPTCLPRTTSFSFDHMMFDLKPGVVTKEQMNNNQLAFSVEDLGISVEAEMTVGPDQNNQISNNVVPGPLEEFLKDEEEEIVKYEDEAAYLISTEQAKAFLNELDTMGESRLNSGEAEPMQQQLEMQAHDDDELSNLLSSSDLMLWNDNKENKNENEIAASKLNHYKNVDGHMGMTNSPVPSSSGCGISCLGFTSSGSAYMD